MKRILLVVALSSAAFAARASDSDFRPASTSEYGWVKPQAAGAGGLTRVQVVAPKKSLKVYRLWDSNGVSANRAKEFGAFWGDFSPKSESAARTAWAVCKEWNHMDMLTVCELPAGTAVAKGPGQTATCKNGKTLRGGPQQIVIANPQTKLKNCRRGSSAF